MKSKKKLSTAKIIGIIAAIFVAFWVFVILLSWIAYSGISHGVDTLESNGVTRGTSTPELDEIMGTYELYSSTDANEENPITPSRFNAIDAGTITVGYYNKNNFTVLDASPQIIDCNDSKGNTFDSPVWFYSSQANVPAGKKVGFETTVFVDDDASPGKYTCTIIVFNGYEHGTYDVSENLNWLTDERTEDNPVYEVGKIEITVI